MPSRITIKAYGTRANLSKYLSYLSMDATAPDSDWGQVKKYLTKDDRPCVFSRYHSAYLFWVA